MKRFWLILIAALTLFARAQAFDTQGDLARLDVVLQSASEVDGHKLELISSLEKILESDRIDQRQRLNLYMMLYDEYYTYSFPEANAMLDKMLELSVNGAPSAEKAVLKNDVLIYKIKLLSAAGMFVEAHQIIENEIDPEALTRNQKQLYYAAATKSYWGYREFVENVMDRNAIADKISSYGEHMNADPDTLDNTFREFQITALVAEGKLDIADRICDQLLDNINTASHNYGLFAYYKAWVKKEQGERDEAVHWYVESAINDIRLSVKENAALYSLAKMVLESGDVERAFTYTNAALRDALVYGSRLRPFQIIQEVSAIQEAYETAKTKQDRKNTIVAAIMGLLAALFLSALLYLIKILHRQHRDHLQIKQMRNELEQVVKDLSEANAAKEEYLGLFLSMCSDYLDKLKKHLSMSQMEDELKNFYNTFDQAFLHLYPNFVEDFNNLLLPQAQIEPKKQELLGTELRIFALIRLGITQSSHIASLLRYSVNTIYNYRAQVKKMSKDDPETFEARVKQL